MVSAFPALRTGVRSLWTLRVFCFFAGFFISNIDVEQVSSIFLINDWIVSRFCSDYLPNLDLLRFGFPLSGLPLDFYWLKKFISSEDI